LLAQGIQSSRFSEKSPDQEKAERRRQVPYHMHINLELIECCHLTSAMLLELPNLASETLAGVSASDDQRRRVVSKTFRRFMEFYERQVFTGPPENTRDFVMAAAKSLMEGDWETACKRILDLPVWALVPPPGGEKVKAMLRTKIQVEALRTYLLLYSNHYEAMSLPQLCSMFDLPENKVHSIVSKMIINKELLAAWDQPTKTLVLHKVVPSPLQSMALKFAEKASMFVESNERLLDSRTGGYGYKDDWSNRGSSSNSRGGWNDSWKGSGGGHWEGTRSSWNKNNNRVYKPHARSDSSRSYRNKQGSGNSSSSYRQRNKSSYNS